MKRLTAVLFVLLLPTTIHAATSYVRTPCTNNGTGTAVGCAAAPGGAGAWNSFANILWDGLGAGDTLYVVGTFDEALSIQAGGSAVADLVIRGNHGAGAGQIGSALQTRNVTITTEDAKYLTVRDLTVYGYIHDGTVGSATLATVWVALTNEIRDASKALVVAGLAAGMQINVTSITNNNSHPFLVKTITTEAEYDKIIVETTGALWSIVDETDASGYIRWYYSHDNITFDNVTVINMADWSTAIDIPGDNLTIKNCDLDGNDLSSHGGIYLDDQDNWRKPNNILIQNNSIHGWGNTVDYAHGDAHCIGIQGVDNLVITGNALYDCAAGIVIYPGSAENSKITGLEITNNSIIGMDFSRHDNQFPGCGIVFSGVNQCPLCEPALIQGNIISTPVNCAAPELGYECTGLASKWSVQQKVYNNTFVANDVNMFFNDSGNAADIRNNISFNPVRYHIYLHGTLGDWTEDYNFFYPNTGTLFYTGGAKNFADYDSAHNYNNTFVSLLDPLFVSATDFHIQGASPAKAAGVNLGTGYLDFDGNPLPTPYGWPVGSYGYNSFGGGTASFSGSVQ